MRVESGRWKSARPFGPPPASATPRSSRPRHEVFMHSWRPPPARATSFGRSRVRTMFDSFRRRLLIRAAVIASALSVLLAAPSRAEAQDATANITAGLALDLGFDAGVVPLMAVYSESPPFLGAGATRMHLAPLGQLEPFRLAIGP